MKSDFIVALTQLAAERNLPREIVLSAIEDALVSAFKRDKVAAAKDISVKLDPGSGDVVVSIVKTVVEEVADPEVEMTIILTFLSLRWEWAFNRRDLTSFAWASARGDPRVPIRISPLSLSCGFIKSVLRPLGV